MLLGLQKTDNFVDHSIRSQNPAVPQSLGDNQFPVLKIFINIDGIVKFYFLIIFIVDYQCLGINGLGRDRT
jgi:hypothetical protein